PEPKKPGGFPFPAVFDKIKLNDPQKFFTKIKELNSPTGEYSAGSLANNNRFKLKGKIGKLRVEKIDSGAILDASELEAKEIVISQNIQGTTLVLLNAPKGKVVFLGEIKGASQVAVNAPDGIVIFGDPNKPW